MIVGGGFAGVACAKRLADADVRVTIIDRHNYNQFQPLLYQVATAQVSTDGVARPLREIFRKSPTVDVKLAEVTAVDPETRTVTCVDGTTFRGDHLVLATGSRPNFFHTPGAEAHTFPLYALGDALRLRSRLMKVFEDADRNPELIDRGALNFVIVGGGATGVETAGALADLVNDVMPDRFEDLALSAARVHLVDPGPAVLGPFSDKAREYATKVLTDKGVQLDLGLSVTEIAPDRVTLSNGEEILTRTVVWAGGLQASALAEHAELPQGHGGRFDVEPDLSVKGYAGVYALGDAANTPGPDGEPFPQLGSVAMQAGRWAAGNILADIDGTPRSAFRYRDKGIMAMVGRNAAIAEVGPRRRELEGSLAFASWLGVHAMLLSGFRERVSALRAWAWDYFTKNRAASIIDRPDAARIDWDDQS